MTTNEELLKTAIYGNVNLFHSNTLSYFQDERRVFEGHIEGIECQLALFSWLSFPDVGVFGCPFTAGRFFTNKMQSGKLGVWLCVEEYHDNAKESGQCLAYFVGYKNECHFYDEKDLAVLLRGYKQVFKTKGWHYNTTSYRNSTHM